MTEPSEAARTAAATPPAEPSPDDLFAAALAEQTSTVPVAAPAEEAGPAVAPSAEPAAPSDPAGPGPQAVLVAPPGSGTGATTDPARPTSAAAPAADAGPSRGGGTSAGLPDLSDPVPDAASDLDPHAALGPGAGTAVSGAQVPAELVAIVLAWQRRHPLARRLRPEDVGYIGLVALPYFGAPGPQDRPEHDLDDLGLPAHVAEVIPTLAEVPAPDAPVPPDHQPAAETPPAARPASPPASAPPAGWRRRLLPLLSPGLERVRHLVERVRGAGPEAWEPGFDNEPLIEGLSPEALIRFARHHAFDEPPGEADWPTRALACAPGRDIHAAHWRFLMTVALRVPGGEPVRVLIGRSRSRPSGRASTPILGVRPLDRRRQMGAMALATVVFTGLGAGWQHRRIPQPVDPAHALATQGPAPVSAASAAPHGAGAMAASSPASMPAAQAAAGAAEAASAAAGASQAGPVDAIAASAPVSERVSGAASPGASAPQGPVSAANLATGPGSSAAETHGAPAAAAVPAPVAAASAPVRPGDRAVPTMAPTPEPVRYALVSRPQGQAAAARALALRLRQALGPEGAALRVEWMDTTAGPVVTLWPVLDEREAERLALTFTRAGVPMRVQPF